MENAKAPVPPPPPPAAGDPPRAAPPPPPAPPGAKAKDPVPPAGPEEQLPRRFGKYTLLRKLAVGGMAELYLALQRSVAGFEKLIVVKRVLPSLVKDTGFITMLLDEARIAATLNHPNIAQVYDAGSVDGQYYIAMEHVHGEDLRQIVRAMKTKNVTAFPLEHALAIVLGCTAGLSYAHEQRTLDGEPMSIVHRDVSPQNVLVTFNGDVKLVDFGIAKAGRSKEEETASGGKLKGKVPYMSPEQAQGHELDARSDIFAVGVMLFELTTGRRLFRGANEFETLKMIVEQEYPLPRSINPNIAPRLEEIIKKALMKDRDARYQTARALQADLEDYIRQEKLAVSPISLGGWMQMLFADKLDAQKAMLMEGKQLADVLAQQAAEEAEAEQRMSLTGASGVRSRKSSSLPWIVVGLVAVLGVVGVGVALTQFKGGAARGPGVIAITSDPPGATVWIDGDQRPQHTPATITGLPVGARHSVKLTRDGYAPFTESVELTQAHQRGAVNAHLVLPTASMFGVVRVVTTPPGAHVLLDGRDTTKVTPATVDGIAPGEAHTLAVSLDGWVTKSQSMTLQAGQVQDLNWTLDRTPLAANESLAHITIDPRDARLTFDAIPRDGPSPYDIRTAARTYRLVIRKDGYITEEHDVVLAGGQLVNLDYHLERNRDTHHNDHNDHPPPPPGGGGPGTLTFDARPWCNVTIDGASVGQTPVVNRSLSAGHHRVVCTNPELGVTRTVQVDIVSGQPTRQRLQLN